MAKKILEMKSHQVNLGESECSITVEARPVQLMVPKLVEVQLKTPIDLKCSPLLESELYR